MLQLLMDRLIRRLDPGGDGDETVSSADAFDPANEGDDTREYMQPEHQVVRLLSRDEGCAWQGQFISELDWSASKTSRVLQEMEENGEIMRYRVGRRKVVCLPGREPEHVGRSGLAAQAAEKPR